jgi:hypothetical protein
MRIEWFQNNMPLKSGSRFMETNSFGFVALDIMYSYPEDAGTYTCRASNALGQAVTSCQLSVHSKKSIVRETQNQTALSQIQYLEDASRQQRPSDVEDSTTQVRIKKKKILLGGWNSNFSLFNLGPDVHPADEEFDFEGEPIGPFRGPSHPGRRLSPPGGMVQERRAAPGRQPDFDFERFWIRRLGLEVRPPG